MIKICEMCDEEFEAERDARKFCSRRCSASYNNIGVRRNGEARKHDSCITCGGSLAGTKSVTKYCSKTCQQRYQYEQYVMRWKQGLEDGISSGKATSKYIHRYIREKYDSACVECGWNKTNPTSGKIPVQLEHIDGNWKNNSEDNLTLLCPSCHSLTSTFGNLNRGNGREHRY